MADHNEQEDLLIQTVIISFKVKLIKNKRITEACIHCISY